MADEISLEFENNDFKCSVDGEIAIVKVKCNAFYSLTDLDISRRILYWFDLVAEEEDIKAILVLNEKGCFGNTAYEVFLSSVTGKDFSTQKPHALSSGERSNIRSREVNVLNSFIMAATNFRRLVVSGLNGTIITPFFGASLASNYRYATEDCVISLSHVKYGLHAGGALPFFLPKYLGIGRATDFVFNGGEITANEAVKLGLINKLFAEENFEEVCLEETRKLCSNSGRYLRWTKELLIRHKKELVDYLHQEEKFIEHY